MSGPLEGILVLDMTYYQNGPWATVMLSDMGADVIKIEDPVNGDPGRKMILGNSSGTSANTYFQTMNRNKRGMTLDLKSDEGLEIYHTMAKKADVIVQNFRVGVVERLGVDYETVRKYNPTIVYASNSGFGPEGPDAKEGVFNLLGMARGGLMAQLAAQDPEPTIRDAGALGDQTGAITLAYSILLGLVARERKGIGQHIQVSQLSGQLMLQALAVNQYLMDGAMPEFRLRASAANPLFNIYRCADDKWIAMGCVQADRYWRDFAEILGIDELIDDPKFEDLAARRENRVELIETIDRCFITKSREEWMRLFRGRRVNCTPLQTYEDIPTDPQVVANGYLVEIEHPELGRMTQVGVPAKLSETPGAPRSAAPEFGQHTEEVLLEFGYDWARIEGFRTRGVI
jgi:crotonobetainyl-CoA:carnitine CoA-transferase CaiB-like acyl-CoA transferase